MKLPNHLHSLQFRLTVGFAVVLAGTLFIVSGWSALRTRAAIDDYGEQVERFQAVRTSDLVRDVFSLDRDLGQVQYSLEQVGRLLPGRVALVNEKGLVLADSHGLPIKPDGDYFTEKERFGIKQPGMSWTIDLGDDFWVKAVYHYDEPIYQLRMAERDGDRSRLSLVLPTPSFEETDPGIFSNLLDQFGDVAEIREESETSLIIDEAVTQLAAEPQLAALEASFQRSIFIAGGAGLIAGALLVALFARVALSPVRSLSNAAQRLGSGDFDQRVPDERRDELGNLARTFNSMAEDLQSAEANRRRMTADIAHELRNPLTNIRGYLEAIKDGVIEPDDAAIDTLHGETIHLSRLVEDLQLLAIADAGALRLHTSPAYISDFAGRAVNAAKPRAMEREIDLRLTTDDGEPLVNLDPTRFAQVISNLLDNALSHSEKGGTATLVVTSSRNESGARFGVLQVVNEGEPIPEDEVGRVFDQFYRIDASRSRSTGGAGLGLTIVKRIVEAHGGAVTAQSGAGVTTFTVSIPESATQE